MYQSLYRGTIYAITLLCTLVSAPSTTAQVTWDELTELESSYKQAEKAYLDALSAYLPGAYRSKFAGLSDREMKQIADTRKLWEFWSLGGSAQFDFQQQFLVPIDQVGEMLIFDAESIRDKDIQEARKKAGRLAEQLDKAKRKEGAELDPTVGVKSPTGIEFPKLDRPHSTVDRLFLMERSMILAQTVGLPDSKDVLMQNAEFCANLDLDEAMFAMYANKVRMLTGVNAWVAHPVTTACARDHSIDRKEGRASGHSSTVPGKEGLGARAKRFGTPVRSEGAGGGKTGEGAIRGLSYGGGHTGPLYRSMRNVVGPGYHLGAMTAMYYHDRAYRHDCQEYRNELFMPPGVTKADLETEALITAYRELQQKQFAKAYGILAAAEKPEDKFQHAVHRYLLARIAAEVDWTLEGVEQFAEAGDVYAAKLRLDTANATLAGIPSFDKAAPKVEKWFEKDAVAAELGVGERFREICAAGMSHDAFRKLIEDHPGSVYAKAAQKCIDDNVTADAKGYAPLMYFRVESPHINKWAYLVDVIGR